MDEPRILLATESEIFMGLYFCCNVTLIFAYKCTKKEFFDDDAIRTCCEFRAIYIYRIEEENKLDAYSTTARNRVK